MSRRLVAVLSAFALLFGATTAIPCAFGSGLPPIAADDPALMAEPQKVVASNGSSGDAFGSSVAIEGDTAVVGAIRGDGGEVGSGMVYVFVRSAGVWSQEATLAASDGVSGDYFGVDVAIDGDTIVVGADGDDDFGSSSGAAYVFTRSGAGWIEQAKLTSADGASGDGFGVSVDVDGDTVVVGACFDHAPDADRGAAYVFSRSGGAWSQESTLVAGDGSADDWFGYSVAIDGTTAVIGAIQDADEGARTGSAYVFTGSGGVWVEQSKLVATDAAAFREFGWSVDVDEDTALVGSQGGIGSAYVFTRAGAAWSERTQLMAPDGAPLDFFGCAVSLADGTALVGATGDDDAGPESGSAYVFRGAEDEWSYRGRLTGPDAAGGDQFGFSVATDGDSGLVGANQSDDEGADSGSATFFGPVRYSCPKGGEFSTPAPGVLANDYDPEGDALEAALLAGPSNGTIYLDSDGSFAYIPDAGFVGSDYFSYKAFDGTSYSSTATVEIAVEPAVEPPSVERLSGATRYETAIALSQQAFPADGTLPDIIVASGADYPDALSASGLAGAFGSPVLLVPSSGGVPAMVTDEIERLAVDGATVWIIGGPVAISDEVVTQLEVGLVDRVERIFGANRYETAAAVSAKIEDVVGTAFQGIAFVASGADFPDALSVAPVAYAQALPVLLTAPGSLPASTRSALAGIDRAIVVGGPVAISEGVQDQIDAMPGTAAERWMGANRYETATEIAANAQGEGWVGFSYVGVASGENFPDALAGGPVAGQAGGVMLLVQQAKLPGPTGGFLSANKEAIHAVQAYGGPIAINDAVLAAIDEALE